MCGRAWTVWEGLLGWEGGGCDPAYGLQSKHGLHKQKVHALSRVLPWSFSRVPALETLILSQAGYPKCTQEELWQFPLRLFPLLGAGWSQEKAGARLQDIDGFPALRALLLRCGGKRPSPVAEGEGSC